MPETTTPAFEYPDPQTEQRVRLGFAAQQVMQTIGARLFSVAPGLVQIELDFQPGLTQQHGYLHAGIVSTLVDSACTLPPSETFVGCPTGGFAAFSLMPADSEVLSVEYKVNFLSPARGKKFLASGGVVKPGRTLMVCSGEVLACQAGVETAVALMQTTIMRLPAEKIPKEESGYEAAHEHQGALMDKGFNLDFRKPASRDELHD